MSYNEEVEIKWKKTHHRVCGDSQELRKIDLQNMQLYSTARLRTPLDT